MRIRFYNARILTMDNSFDIISGELWVNNGRIEHIGDKRKDMPIFDKTVNVENNLLMPGFKNAHTHSAMTFLRGYAEDMPLETWLNERVFPSEAKLKEGDCYNLVRLAMLEYIEGGITACMDMYAFEEETVQAAEDTGMRLVLSDPMNDFSGSLSRQEELYKKFNGGSDIISKVLGFHAVYTTSEQLLKELSALAHKYKAPVYTHCSESEAEVANCIKAHGKTPVQYLNDMGMFDFGGAIYHGVHLTDEDCKILKDKNVSVITCPSSNLKLASGIANISKLMDMGINIGIGTDGPASNNALDMFKEMYLVSTLQKYLLKDASAMPAEKVLKMATVGSARAMGLNDCDCLREGKRADMIMVDLKQPDMQPENNIVKSIVYSASKKNIKMTMINGNIVYMDGVYYIGESIDNIFAAAEITADRLKEEKHCDNI